MAQFFAERGLGKLIVSGVIVVVAVMLLIGLRIAYRRVRKVQKERGQITGRQRTATSIVFSFSRILIILAVILIVLEIYNVKITSLLAGLGIAGAVVGLALQDVLKDVFMGTQIVWDNFYQIGDVVRYGDFEGVVIDFNLRTTKLRSIDDSSILAISNRNISEIQVLSEQVHLFIPLSYKESLPLSQEILMNACEKVSRIEGISDCVNLGLNELNASSVEWKIRVFCPPAQKPALRRAALRCICDCLAEAGVKIPFNQLDVHFDEVKTPDRL